MSQAIFPKALKKLGVHEGGFVDDPRDSGGATNKGVTQRVYNTYRKAVGADTRSVRNITDDEVTAIYKRYYWDVVRGDELPAGVDYMVFDGAVNSGPGQSIKWLQRGLGVKDDGVLGMETMGAIATADLPRLVNDVCDQRLAFLKALKRWKYYKNGWKSRVADVRHIALAWVIDKSVPAPAPTVSGTPKGYIEDAKSIPSTAPGDVCTGAGTMGAILSQAIGQLSAFGDVKYVHEVLAVLTGISVLVGIGGVALRMYSAYKAKGLKEALGVGAP